MKNPTAALCAIALLGLFSSHVLAAEQPPYLPPADLVAKVLRANPMVQASTSQIRVEEANRSRLEAGNYEWNIRLGGQQRRSNPPLSPEERFGEWNAALERPLRLPGKAADDAELGSAGVALAEKSRGDALHETGRGLLKSWFLWLKEGAAAAQWDAQVSLLSKQTKATQRRQQLGDAARLEAILTDAALAQAEAQMAQARVRKENAATDLQRRFPGLPLSVPDRAAEPPAITGDLNEWVDEILTHSHELGMARGETRKAQIAASRSDRDRMPDPTFGLHMSTERGGEDHIVGAYISIPLPGGGRRATADGAVAQAAAASHREAAARQKVSAEAAALYQSATAALATWQANRSAAERLTRAADMTARAYTLGEGNLSDMLAARRLANEAQLAARLAQLEAFEFRYRLQLDAHRLWVLKEEHPGHD